MAKSFLARAVCFFLLVPALAYAGLLDDYYLAKFGVLPQAAKAVTAVHEQAAPDRCRTHLYRSVKRDWNLLEPATQVTLAKTVWARPALAGAASYPSPEGRFTIHYATSGSEAPVLTDVTGVAGVPDWVEDVAQVFDEVYRHEVTTMGYRPPPVTRCDVYLRDLASRAEPAFGFTNSENFVNSTTSAASYIEIDKAFAAGGPLNREGRLPLLLLQVTAAHEFHHVIQFGYNFYFDPWYAEVTATWIEDEVYESVNQLYDYLPSYLPKAGTITLDAPLGGNSEYGRWIFNRHLAERHGLELIRDVWVRLGAMSAPADQSDIPMIPVIDAALKARGSTLAGDFTGFAKKIYLRDWTSHTSDIGRIPVVVPQATFSSYPLSTAQSSGINSTVSTLPRYAFASYKFLPGVSAPADLTLTIPGVPAGIDLVALKTSTTGTVQEFALERATGTITVPSFNAADTAEVQLVISSSARESAVVPPPAPSSGGGGGGGGGCFIATAAYGSYLHPKVAELRSFRDSYLLTNAPGRLFVALYYRVSPPLARVIAEHDLLRAAARGLLVPLILAVEYPVPALLLMLLSGGGAGWRLTRRRQAARFA